MSWSIVAISLGVDRFTKSNNTRRLVMLFTWLDTWDRGVVDASLVLVDDEERCEGVGVFTS